jgi:hypothetical protein
MQTWFKTCRAVASPLAVRLVNGLPVVILAIVLLGSSALSQPDSVRLEMSAIDLARKVVTNELRLQNEDHDHWMYRLEKEESGGKQAQEILETNSGSLSQLLSIDGHPLDAKQQRKENERMQRLVSHPDEQRKLQQVSNKKAEQGARLFRILPDVFVFGYAGRQGDLVTLTFRPDPTFQPPSLEARVSSGKARTPCPRRWSRGMRRDRNYASSWPTDRNLLHGVLFGGPGRLRLGGRFSFRRENCWVGEQET